MHLQHLEPLQHLQQQCRFQGLQCLQGGSGQLHQCQAKGLQLQGLQALLQALRLKLLQQQMLLQGLLHLLLTMLLLTVGISGGSRGKEVGKVLQLLQHLYLCRVLQVPILLLSIH